MTNPMRYLWRKMAGAKRTKRIPQFAPYRPPEYRHGLNAAKVAYRRDFYVPGNIIGYAGPIEKATIFFMQGTIYGHIVQWDPDTDNIGREKVDDFAHIGGGYYIGNEMIKGSLVAVERYIYPVTGELSPPFYIYGHKFVDCRNMPQVLKDMLMPSFESAIRRFHMRKFKWGTSEEII